MKTISYTKILAVSFIIISGVGVVPACAQSSQKEYMMMGLGVESCGTWGADRVQNQAFGDEQWVLGSVTGQEEVSGLMVDKTVTINTDANGIWGWIDNYCRAYPTSTLSDAVSAFVETSGMLKFP